eukprot:Pgem_evm1s13102
MIAAAREGHLEIVRFLYNKRSEKCMAPMCYLPDHRLGSTSDAARQVAWEGGHNLIV